MASAALRRSGPVLCTGGRGRRRRVPRAREAVATVCWSRGRLAVGAVEAALRCCDGVAGGGGGGSVAAFRRGAGAEGARGGLKPGRPPPPSPPAGGRARAPRPWAAPAAGGGASLSHEPGGARGRGGRAVRRRAGSGAGAGGAVPCRPALLSRRQHEGRVCPHQHPPKEEDADSRRAAVDLLLPPAG